MARLVFPALFLFIGAFLENMDPLIRLPNLVRVLVLIEFQKLSIRIESRLDLIQLIVTKRANKPLPRVGGFHFGDHIEGGQGSRVVAAEVVGGAEILPIGEIVAVELQRGFELDFSGGEIAFLEQEAA